jgi:hypothetical protein
VLLALAAATIMSPSSANAAPADQACAATAFRQHDMAGAFISAEYRMRLEIYPCGGSYLQWDNAYGTHFATYGSTIRLAGGGVGALPLDNSYERLDGVNAIGFKPAEPGFLQVITVNPYGEVVGVYRLRKV